MERHEFLKRFASFLLSLWLKPIPGTGGSRQESPGDSSIPYRRLGRTGVKVSILGPGGFHIGRMLSEKEAIRLVHHAIEAGINFFDTAESYQRGGSEIRLGKALQGRRDNVFLMTKTYDPAGRDAEGARRHLEASLRRLRTDYLDLWQLHSIQSPEDVDRAFRPGGAMEYLMKARGEGKVRFIGVTGHRDPQAHLRALYYWDQGWKFDTLQMPLNPIDYHQKSFTRRVLPEAVKRGIGVIAMKTSADGRLLREKLCTIDQCLNYVWTLPIGVAVVGMTSLKELKHNVELARRFKPMPDAEKSALLSSLASKARMDLEWYKR